MFRRRHVPPFPVADVRTTRLEGEPPTGPQDGVDRGEGRRPVVVAHEHLGDVAGHHDQIGIRSHGDEIGGVALHPRDALGVRLGAGDVQ
jgi:hypothetical protein